VNTEKSHVCLAAFNIVCSYISTRDLVQEHIAFKIWLLAAEWEMPKDAGVDTSQHAGKSSLVHLKYSYRYMNQFGEPDDDWLDTIEATSDELLGAYTKAKDEAMSSAFGARGKRRLNMVFDVIGFIYHDYCFPARTRGLKRKSELKSSSAMLKQKKLKVLTHGSKTYYSEGAAELPALLVTDTASDLPSKVIIFLTFTLQCSTSILFESFGIFDYEQEEIKKASTDMSVAEPKMADLPKMLDLPKVQEPTKKHLPQRELLKRGKEWPTC
jgi:hypothetical protein